MSFASLKLSSHLLNSLEKHGFKKPYPIQKQAIPAILDGKDVLGLAQTGSGKTASYVLPVLMLLEKQTTTKNRHINVLVMVPTRELAIQVEAVFSQFGADVPFPFKSMAVYGGVSINPQMKALNNVNVLVATPGRLLELAEANALHFSSVSTLILDEADKLLNLGFKEEMDKVFALLPRKRQNLLFSATLSPDVKSMEQVLLTNPVVINIAPEQERVELINQVGYFVKDEKKGPLLRYLIKHKEMEQVLVFTSSVYQADLVAEKLQKNGISARAIHSKKSQGNRTETLHFFKQGEITILVATDLLSRGIDIEFLPYVINYELPRSPKDFVHRIGRTGRAENPGEAITFVTEESAHHFKVIQKKMKQVVDMVDSENLDLHGF
ncbi:DEAD/DEAH box helicase [Flavobacteriales bacterium]|nr:DEAD/DEAH box helicase [Flavobacteriales bacterium]